MSNYGIEKYDTYSDSIHKIFKGISLYLIFLCVIFLSLDLFENINLGLLNTTLISLTLVYFSFIYITKKSTVVKASFATITASFIFILTVVSILVFTISPTQINLLTLLIITIINGIFISNSNVLTTYYLFSIIGISILSFYSELVNIIHILYLIFFSFFLVLINIKTGREIKSLAAKKIKYKQLFDQNISAVIHTTIDGKILECNKACLEMFGYSNIDEFLNLSVDQLFLDRNFRIHQLKELEEKQKSESFQTIIQIKNNRKLIVNNSSSLLYNTALNENTILSTLIDITEIQETNQKYKSLFEESNSGILLISLNNGSTQILDCNKKCHEMFGYSKLDFLGLDFDKTILNGVIETKEITEELKHLKAGEKKEFEILIKLKEVTTFVELSFVKITSIAKDLVQVFIKDISKRKTQEEALMQSKKSFQNIVDNSPASIFIFTSNKLVYKNLNGIYTFEKYLNNNSEDLYEIFPKHYQHLLSELISETKSGISSYTEISLWHDGTEKRFSLSLLNIVHNNRDSLFIMLTDITLQNEYNLQKIRAEIAEETNKKLFEEIKRHEATQNVLLENTSKLNALFESSKNLFVVTINRDLEITSFNSSFKTMMKDYLNKEVDLGTDFLKSFPVEENALSTIIKKFKLALRGDSVDLISNFQTLKGKIWIESFISPVKVIDQPIKEIAFIAHNITDKVLSEQRVLESEANIKATVFAIPDMLFKIDKAGYFTDYRLNTEGENLFQQFGLKEDIKGKHISDIFLFDEIQKVFQKNIEKALKTGEIVTQHFTLPIKLGKNRTHLNYENRYSRINKKEVVVIVRDISDKIASEEKLLESIKEKEILLKEVHHRVKNNLQVISSILNLQSSYVHDPRTLEIINESQNRIRSMSYIHESLYHTNNFSSINFHDYITNLVQNLVHSYQLYSGKTKLILKIEKINLPLDQAIPCGLILNELVSNSLKHAYSEEEGGEIVIEIYEKLGKVYIGVQDFGVGLPQGFKIEDSDSLGLGLVDTLVDQLDGELTLKTEGGTNYLIIFGKQDL